MIKLNQAVILVGGKASRVKSILGNTPKPLFLINNIPFLKFLIDKLLYSGIDNFVLICGPNILYFSNFLKKFYPNLRCKLVSDYKQLGTANALFKAKTYLKDYFILLNGDTLLKFNYKNIIDYFNSQKKKKSFFVINKVKNTSRYGRVLEHGNLIKKIIEKKNSFAGYINSGIYVFEKKEIVKFIGNNLNSLEKECIPKFLKKNRITFLKANCEFIDIGTKKSLNSLSTFLEN